MFSVCAVQTVTSKKLYTVTMTRLMTKKMTVYGVIQSSKKSSKYR